MLVDMVLYRAQQPEVWSRGVIVSNVASQVGALECCLALHRLPTYIGFSAHRTVAASAVQCNGFVSIQALALLFPSLCRNRRFQALQKTYEQLSETILHTVRVDIRCRVWHHLDLALSPPCAQDPPSCCTPSLGSTRRLEHQYNTSHCLCYPSMAQS